MSHINFCSRARTTALALAFVVASLAPGASAQTPEFPAGIDPIDIPPEHDPLAHAWDRPDDRGGFYLRGGFGLGYMAERLGPAPWDEDDYLAKVAGGFGTSFNLDIGAMLAPWVALHVSGHAGVLWSGDLDIEFGTYNDSSARVAAYGVAPAATFFTPHDFFFTTAFGMGIAHTKYSGYRQTTNPGFYMNMVMGKDLYVGRHLSCGIQFQIVYMRLGADDEDDESRVREFMFGTSVGFDSL